MSKQASEDGYKDGEAAAKNTPSERRQKLLELAQKNWERAGDRLDDAMHRRDAEAESQARFDEAYEQGYVNGVKRVISQNTPWTHR